MKRKSDPLFIFLISVLAGVIAVLIAGFGPLTHLSDVNKYVPEEEVRSVLMTGTGRASVVFSDGDGSGLYVNNLLCTLYPKTHGPMELKVTVYVKEDGREETPAKVITDFNPLYDPTAVFTFNMEHVTRADIETADGTAFSLGEVAVDNSFHFNQYLFLFVTLSAFVLLSLLRLLAGTLLSALKGREDGKPFPYAGTFAFTALGLGIALCLCLPVNKVGCDEETHLQAVLQIASFPSMELHVSDGMMWQVTVTEFNNPESQPSGFLEQVEFHDSLRESVDYKLGKNSPEFKVMWNRIPAYLTMAFGMKLAKGLSLPWGTVIVITRLFNLFTYVALMALAIRLLPSGKALLTVIGLLPENLFLASTVSYDPFVTSFLSLGIAMCFRLCAGKEKKFLPETVLMLFFFMLGILPKAVYMPLLLLCLLIPFRRGTDRGRKILYGGLIAAVFAAAFCVFLLPTLLSPSLTGDIRGGEVSEMGQLAYIAANPSEFAFLLLSHMAEDFSRCFFGPDCTTFMGHLVSGTTEYAGEYVPFLVLIAGLAVCGTVTAVLKRRTPFLKWQERLFAFLTVFAASALIWTAMYVAFTEPGADRIAGVQGRYFIPLLFPFYFALGAEEGGEGTLPAGDGKGLALLVRNERLWYHLTVSVCAVCIVGQAAKAILVPYCM